MSSSTRNLTDVPEEDGDSHNSPSSPYSTPTPTASSSNLSVNGPHRTPRNTPSIRTLGKSSNDLIPSASGSVKRSSSTSSSSTTVAVANGSKTPRNMTSHSQMPVPKYRANPRLPHEKDVESVPSTVMYWSRAPVWGTVPMRNMRAHTVTLVDTTIWLFGGCDDKDNSRDIYCFDIGMSIRRNYSTFFFGKIPAHMLHFFQI
jgi:Rab9 effector protein with kelch motifs